MLVYYEGSQLRNSGIEEVHRAGLRGGIGLLFLSRPVVLPAPPYAHQPGSMQMPFFRGFSGGVICCCLVSQPSPTLQPRVEHQAPVAATVSLSLLRVMPFESMMPSNHLILQCHLLLPSVSSSIMVFSSELAPCIRWPNYWSFSISPFNEY